MTCELKSAKSSLTCPETWEPTSTVMTALRVPVAETAEVARTGYWQGEVWDRLRNDELFPKWLTISVVRARVMPEPALPKT